MKPGPEEYMDIHHKNRILTHISKLTLKRPDMAALASRSYFNGHVDLTEQLLLAVHSRNEEQVLNTVRQINALPDVPMSLHPKVSTKALGRMPALLLGVAPDETHNLDWTHFNHATQRGFSSRELIGVTLDFQWGIQRKFADLHETMRLVQQETPLDQLLCYRELLTTTVGVDCTENYRAFEYGVYPVDVTREHLDVLSDTELPEKLEDLYPGTLIDLPWQLWIVGQAHAE